MPSYQLKFNLPGLLRLLGTNIYSDPKVCIREMIQNAHDSCVRRQVEAGHRGSRIQVTIDRGQRTISFADNGAGMTEEEIHECLSTIGRGYTADLRRVLEEKGSRREAEQLIGQFGLGLLSAFAIADRIEITTRSYQPGSPTLCWQCRGDVGYTVDPTESAEVGTAVTIYVQEKHASILNEEQVQKAIKQYADLLSIPIYLGRDRTPLNAMNAPWQHDATEVEYVEYVRSRFDIPAMEVIPLCVRGEVAVYGVLYIPKQSSVLSIGEYGDLDIYVRGMFIKGQDRELLPRWAKFVRGIVDSPSLMPTVSRDAIIKDEAYAQVRDVLGEAILAHLEHLAHADPRQLRAIVLSHNTLIKIWAVEDDAFFDRVADLVQFDTDVGKLSIPEYLKRTEGGNTIYYFREGGSGTQQKVLFGARDIPVIDASYGAEEPFLQKYAARHPQVSVRRLSAEADFIFEPVASDDGWQRLEEAYTRLHRIEARVVAFEPADLPAVLVSKRLAEESALLDGLLTSSSVSDEIKALLGSLKQERDRAAQGMLTQGTVLHLNARNPVIQMLRQTDPVSEVFQVALIVLYNNAVLFGQHAVTAENAIIMCQSNNRAVELMIQQALELRHLRGEA
ncbi:MAG TPA: ATP-binding protein [Anaerolineae bacterium]|nr:ATP-binding protein [Anaerolineae bacterium]